VDDDPQVRSLLFNILSESDWLVSEADTAHCAFKLLDEGRWQLVFCDVMLGADNGYTVLRQFTEAQPDAHVVVMTGHGSAVLRKLLWSVKVH
jgi:DNA-binding NtrC family response regulator